MTNRSRALGRALLAAARMLEDGALVGSGSVVLHGAIVRTEALDAGTITQEEFDQLKAKALA